MNALFALKNQYTVNDSVDNVQRMLDLLLAGKWYDFPQNITGEVHDDGSFKLLAGGPSRYITFLQGRVKEENSKTIIAVTARPQYGMLLVSYFFLLAFLTLFFLHRFSAPVPLELILVFALLSVGAFSFIIASSKKMIDHFETLMQLHSNPR